MVCCAVRWGGEDERLDWMDELQLIFTAIKHDVLYNNTTMVYSTQTGMMRSSYFGASFQNVYLALTPPLARSRFRDV